MGLVCYRLAPCKVQGLDLGLQSGSGAYGQRPERVEMGTKYVYFDVHTYQVRSIRLPSSYILEIIFAVQQY